MIRQTIKTIMMTAVGLLVGMTLHAQVAVTVTGTVIDETDQGLPGATIQVMGVAGGVITDLDGKFTIKVPSEESVLKITFVGYREQEITIGSQREFTVKMTPAANELDEVTIVAFGKQKKESVIGSVTTINPSELKVPSSNLTTAFAGQMAGVIAYQRSGEPGRDNADFFVRGITTFGQNTKPLILIDNIELTSTDLARLQPDDIASFSIMKDATATALYGARGANGVILVNTKQGKEGGLQIFARLENSVSAPTTQVEFADPLTYMRLANEAQATRNPLLARPYSESKIENTANGMFPIRYPTNDWMGLLMSDYAMNQRAFVNAAGGGGVLRYYVSAGFNKDNGIIKVDKRQNFNNNIDNKTYSVRSTMNISLTPTTELIVRMNGTFDDYSGPLYNGQELWNLVMHSNSVLFPPYYPDNNLSGIKGPIMFGNYNDNQYINPYAETVRGYKEKSRSQLLFQMEAKQDLAFLTEGLNVRAMFNIARLQQFSVDRYYNPYYYQLASFNELTGEYALNCTNENTGTDWLDYSEQKGDKQTLNTFYFEGMMNYNRVFADDHAVSGLLVFQARQQMQANTGSFELSLPSRNLGLSGRLTYAWKSRYFGEFNFGYNGSERFHESHRWGFFPSAGVGWMISNEPFFEPLKKTVTNLKLRYSYGYVGNDQIGDETERFFYLSEMIPEAQERKGTFGTAFAETQPGWATARYPNPDITWELAVKHNYALELGLWNKLTVIAEYFTEHRSNILMARTTIPETMGLTVIPKANVGKAKSRGVDIQLEYQQNWNTEFWTSARGNFTFARGEYLEYEEPDYAESWRYMRGRSINQTFGYLAERLFVDDGEAKNAPPQEISSYKYGGGDIKYTDINRDNRITEIDKVPIGNPTVPEIVYGFGFSVGYKGFDASIFFQGAENQSFWIDATATSPFNNIADKDFGGHLGKRISETQLLKAYADSHWSEDAQDRYALWPRLSPTENGNNTVSSTWFMRDGSFLRLKQAEIGYSIPGKWKEKLRMDNFRIYLNGSNLMLLSRFKMWDVEMAGNGLDYPIQRVFNIGIHATFK